MEGHTRALDYSIHLSCQCLSEAKEGSFADTVGTQERNRLGGKEFMRTIPMIIRTVYIVSSDSTTIYPDGRCTGLHTTVRVQYLEASNRGDKDSRAPSPGLEVGDTGLKQVSLMI